MAKDKGNVNRVLNYRHSVRNVEPELLVSTPVTTFVSAPCATFNLCKHIVRCRVFLSMYVCIYCAKYEYKFSFSSSSLVKICSSHVNVKLTLKIYLHENNIFVFCMRKMICYALRFSSL